MEEEHVKSLAEVLFAETVEEESWQQVQPMQKAQSDQVAIRGTNLFKEAAGESVKSKATPSSKRQSEGKESAGSNGENLKGPSTTNPKSS